MREQTIDSGEVHAALPFRRGHRGRWGRLGLDIHGTTPHAHRRTDARSVTLNLGMVIKPGSWFQRGYRIWARQKSISRFALLALGPGSRSARARALAALARDTRICVSRTSERQRAKSRDPGATQRIGAYTFLTVAKCNSPAGSSEARTQNSRPMRRWSSEIVPPPCTRKYKAATVHISVYSRPVLFQKYPPTRHRS